MNAPARVLSFEPGADGLPWPRVFEARGQRFEAALDSPACEDFLVTANWWERPPEGGLAPQSHFYRLPLVGGGLVELVREPGGEWRLYKVYD